MKCTAIIINFLREPYLWKCIDSLKAMYPDIKIKVGENGEYTEAKKERIESYKGSKYYDLPFDSGVCVGRNSLLKQVRTKYVLVGDDDFMYNADAKVDQMVEFLEANPDYDLVGGRVYQNGSIQNYQGNFTLKNGELKIDKIDVENEEYKICAKSGLRYTKCDLTFNFFVARTKAVREVLWDEGIKVAYEHASFFIAMKEAGKTVAFSPDPVVIHKPKLSERINNELYSKYRMRRTDQKRFFEKHNIHTLTDMRGNTVKSPVMQTEDLEKGDGEITFIIKTLKRQKSLEALMFSIAKYYPNARILVGDDDDYFDIDFYKDLWTRLAQAGLTIKPTAYNLPPDCGLAEGRNILVSHVTTEYLLLLDDDFIFDENTDISKFKKILESDPTLGVVGGMLFMNGNPMKFAGFFKRELRQLIYQKFKDEWNDVDGAKFTYVDFVLNFALFRRSVFNYVKWDKQLKIAGEHTDFYLQLKETDWKVAYTPDVSAIHTPTSSPEYKKLRGRRQFTIKMFQKWGIKSTYYEETGYVYEYDEETNSLKNYRKPHEN